MAANHQGTEMWLRHGDLVMLRILAEFFLTPDVWPEGKLNITSGKVGDRACQAGLLWEQILLAVVWIETEPRRLLKRHKSILSKQQEALWYPHYRCRN